MRKSIALFLLACVSLQQYSTQARESYIPALKAEPQTAEWAQSWWMPRHEEKLAAKSKAEHVDLLFVGDSITQGWEGAGKKAWETHFSQYHPFNLGFSGDRTEQVLWRMEHGEFDGLNPKVTVLMIGTNNTGHRQDPAAETAEGIRQIVEAMHNKMPDSHILLLAIFPRGENADDSLRVLNTQINELIKELDAEDYVSYLDIGSKFLAEDGKLSRDIMPDLLHLNEASYETWAQAILPEIEKHMK